MDNEFNGLIWTPLKIAGRAIITILMFILPIKEAMITPIIATHLYSKITTHILVNIIYHKIVVRIYNFHGITITGILVSLITLSVTLPNTILSMALCLPEAPNITKSKFSSFIVSRISMYALPSLIIALKLIF